VALAVVYGAALGRVAKARLFGITLVTVGVLLVAEFLLLAAVPDIVPVAWLTVMAAGAIAATISWTVATSSLDVRQARRLFPVCTAAAIAGYLAGSLLAGPVAGAVGAPALIGLEGLLFAAAAAVITVLARRHVGSRWIPQRIARDHRFGMPLHAQREWMTVHTNRFDEAVRRTRFHLESRAERGHALTMQRIHAHPPRATREHR